MKNKKKKSSDNKKLKVGTVHWRRGYQDVNKVLGIAKKGDTLVFPNRNYEANKQVVLHKDITLQGSNSSVIVIPNPKSGSISKFQEHGVILSSNPKVKVNNLIFEVDPETVGIEVDSSFNGELTLSEVTTRHVAKILFEDDRDAYPSLKIHGSGKLLIIRSTLDYVAIDAPNMDIIIEQSTIGTYSNNSLIRGKSIKTVSSTLNNIQVSTRNGTHSGLKTNGGLALSGNHQMVRTTLEPLNPPRSDIYPKALTYIVGLPKSKLFIEDIASSIPDSAPYYRHFDVRQSKVSIKGTERLSNQLLTNLAIKSEIFATGLEWISDPGSNEYQMEQQKLEQAK